MQTDVEPAMTVRDVAALLNVDEKTIYRLITKRELPGFKVLGSWRFQRHDLDGWIEAKKLDKAGMMKDQIKMMQQQLQMAPSKNQMRMAQMMGGRKKMPKMR